MFLTSLFKDVRANIFYSIDFFKLLLQTDNDLLVSEMK